MNPLHGWTLDMACRSCVFVFASGGQSKPFPGCVGRIFPRSPCRATSIELRKAITDNGPNGTRRRSGAEVGEERRATGREGKDIKREIRREEGERGKKRERSYPWEIRMYRVVIKRLRLLSRSLLLACSLSLFARSLVFLDIKPFRVR